MLSIDVSLTDRELSILHALDGEQNVSLKVYGKKGEKLLRLHHSLPVTGELCKTSLIQFDCAQEGAVHFALIVGFVKKIPHPLTDAQGRLIENLRGEIFGVPREVHVGKNARYGYCADEQ